MNGAWTTALVIVGLLTFRAVLFGIDRRRIRSFVENKGGRICEITWSPFGPGWTKGRYRTRGYRVYYFDSTGREHKAYCYTDVFYHMSFQHDEAVNAEDSSKPSDMSDSPTPPGPSNGPEISSRKA